MQDKRASFLGQVGADLRALGGAAAGGFSAGFRGAGRPTQLPLPGLRPGGSGASGTIGQALGDAARSAMKNHQEFGQAKRLREMEAGIDLQKAKDLEVFRQQLASQHAHNPIHAMLTNAGTIAAGGLMLQGASMLNDHAKVQGGYKKMLNAYPELARENPERVRAYFDAIASGSPDIAAQPLVAGSLVKRMLNYDGFDPSTFQELAATQATIDRTKNETAKNVISLSNSALGQMHTYGIGANPNLRR